MFRLFQEILREFQSVKNKAHVNAFPYIAILFPPHPPAGNVLLPASAQVLSSCRPSGRFRDRSAERKAMRITANILISLKRNKTFFIFISEACRFVSTKKEAGFVVKQGLPEYLNNQLRDWIPFPSVILKKTVI